ncbi:hypothetical protein [Devosia rhizoryzae]|uniref:Uncharacterized protein n=1 Tax=Devosia rhizoryzae TaxID=2774137 RepID=A0ABX7C1C1_9HYPH|nr:hypothetical protein [Devosia rhizoryzae]QQR38025.1 hypothetical protein JI748_09450 [Devosia rhizoryzae]
MQVNVFISEVQQDGERTQMLVLPTGPAAAIPIHLQDRNWRYFATTDADDQCIGLPKGEVSVALSVAEYLLTTPEVARLS